MGENMAEHLIELLERGGFYPDVAGDSPRVVLTQFVDALAPGAPLDKAALLKTTLEREDLMTTAQGHGIAIPHPRNPMLAASDAQFVALALLKKPVDWRALDGEPVFAVFLVVSSSARNHLQTLSKLNFFCQNPAFRDLLKTGASPAKITGTIAEIEKGWKI
jgi:PTS system nitrogen regulatory IIA component